MLSASRIAYEVRHLVLRHHWRAVHVSFGALAWEDVATGWRAAGRDGDTVPAFEAAVSRVLGQPGAVAFGAGRMALLAILRALGIGPGDEVVIPAFTCVVVPLAVHYAGARPVYADLDPATYAMKDGELERLVTPRTRAVLVQHTFGIPVPVTAIRRRLAPGVAIIEDCAHTLGGRGEEGMLGTLGDAAFFSTELTKPLNLGCGGFATARDPQLLERIREELRGAPVRGRWRDAWTLAASRALYAPSVYALGKFVLAALYRARALEASITAGERAGVVPDAPLRGMPGPSAGAGVRQVGRLAAANARRVAIAAHYDEAFAAAGRAPAPRDPGVPLLRYPFFVADKAAATEYFARRQIQLGGWFDHPVHPSGSNLAAVGYEPGVCSGGEWMARHCVNLPTHPGLRDDDVRRICGVLAGFLAVDREPTPLLEVAA